MKKLFIFITFLISLSILISGCKSDSTTTEPEAKTYTISGVISDANGNGVANISVDLTGSSTSSVVTDNAGAYSFDELASGGNFTITPTSDVYDFDIDYITITDLAEDDSDNSFKAIGIFGTWVSEGADVAPLLAVPPLNVVKITATFNTNNTYTVIQKDNQGAEIELAGTFTTKRSSVSGIFDIIVDQTQPTPLTVTGIYQIDWLKSPFTMKYEVLVTTPDYGLIPPTAEGGFGSSNSGALGETNIQKYVRQ